MTIQEKQNEIIEEFSFFDNWEDRYAHLADLGKHLPHMPENMKEEGKLIKGCQSKVWLDAQMNEDKIVFAADSDAILPKGIAALLMRVYSNEKPMDIIQSNQDFIEEIGLHEFLSPNRANGLLAMIKQIKFYALVFSKKHTS